MKSFRTLTSALPSFMLGMVLFCFSHSEAYAQWQLNGLIRDGSSSSDRVFGVFKPVPGQSKVIACGTLGASGMTGVSGKGMADAFAFVYENGVITHIKAFGGSKPDGFNGGLAISPNQYVFWGQTASDDGDIISNPLTGSSCAWILFTDSLLNVTGSHVIQASGQLYSSSLMGGLNTQRNKLAFNGRIMSDIMTGEHIYLELFTDLNGQVVFESQSTSTGLSMIYNPMLRSINQDTFFIAAQMIFSGNPSQFSNEVKFYAWDSVQQEYEEYDAISTNPNTIDDAMTGYTQHQGIYYFSGASSSCGSNSAPAIKTTKFDFSNLSEQACFTHPDGLSYKDVKIHPLMNSHMVFTSTYLTDSFQSEGKVWMGHVDTLGNVSASMSFGGTSETNAYASYFDPNTNELIIAGNTHATDGDFSATTSRGGSDFWIARFVNPTLSISPEVSSDIKVYPNPVSMYNGFVISHEFTGNPQVALIDMHGKIIPIQIQYESNALRCVPNHAISPGCYFISIQHEHNKAMHKIIVQP